MASHAVSLVLVRVDSGVQRPVYYVSKSLHEAEVRYLPLEKAILMVVNATRKLPHYFQVNMVVVLTRLPLKSLLRSDDYTRRVAKWGTFLGTFDIKYMPCTFVKGQVLAGRRVCRIPIGSRSREARYGWKISWHDLPTRSFILESIH